MSKKVISMTLPETLIDQIDAQVEETGAKSRSSFVTSLIEQSLSGRTFSLSEEEHQALLTYAQALRTTPEEIAKTVLTRVAGVGEKVDELSKSATPVIPTD